MMNNWFENSSSLYHFFVLDARYHPYSTPNTSKSSSSPSSFSVHDISGQSDVHPPMTSSPCSSVNEEQSTCSSAFLQTYPIQTTPSTTFDNSENNHQDLSGYEKENYPLPSSSSSYYSSVVNEQEYERSMNQLYANPTVLPKNEPFVYPSSKNF